MLHLLGRGVRDRLVMRRTNPLCLRRVGQVLQVLGEQVRSRRGGECGVYHGALLRHLQHRIEGVGEVGVLDTVGYLRDDLGGGGGELGPAAVLLFPAQPAAAVLRLASDDGLGAAVRALPLGLAPAVFRLHRRTRADPLAFVAAGGVEQIAGDDVLAVLARQIEALEAERRPQPEGQRQLLRAGLEQRGLVGAGDDPVVLALFHGLAHDLLDQPHLAQHVVRRHRREGGLQRAAFRHRQGGFLSAEVCYFCWRSGGHWWLLHFL